ncbi:hypothetical protein ACIHDR_03660 [Nocardia sp. NPDC052278]|uniref:hypothetical protein n=1 Tax=unclassified Nocardia TaxID=2637762 RepID=UPI0036ABE31A
MGDKPEKVTPPELLDRAEQLWAKRFRGVSLAAEISVRDSDAAKVARCLGWAYRKRLRDGGDATRIFTRWPAGTVVGMTSVAARSYQQGTYWPQLWDAVGHVGDPGDQKAWGSGFLAALDRLGMPDFAWMPLRYVGPILMHAGMPSGCLTDYFQLLLRRRKKDPHLTADEFLAWVLTPGRELYELDKPAQRFLKHGSVFAADFVDRSFDLLDRLADPAPDLDGVGLPARVTTTAQDLVTSGALVPEPRTGDGRSGWRKREMPRLALDPFGQGVTVVLPATDSPDGDIQWLVTIDGVSNTVRSQAHWAGGTEIQPAARFPLIRPARTVAVSLLGWEHAVELDVVDAKAPLLVFTEDGRRLPASAPLPPDVVWLLYPDQYGLSIEGAAPTLIHGRLPLGWAGWRLHQVDLADAKSIGLTEMPGMHRTVRGHSHPRIVTGEPVLGVTTPYGTPVLAQPPSVWLPGIPEAETSWTIEVRPARDDTSAVSRAVTVFSESQDITDLWDQWPRPVLGSFELTVRGPLGRGIRRTVFIAEGLSARYTPPVRTFGPSGLVKAHAEVVAAIGARVTPHTLRLAAEEASGAIQYATAHETATATLMVTPPHVLVMHEAADRVSEWRSGPMTLASDLFTEEPGALLVQVPGATTLAPLHVVVGDASIQLVPFTGRIREGTARFDLTRIKDTVSEHQRAELFLELGSPLQVAIIRPRRLAAAIRRDGDELELVDGACVDGLTAGVYASTAPWREPEVVPVEHGRITLSDNLRDAGPLAVLLQIDDPWVPVEWPRWPESAHMVGAEGHLVSADPEEAALAAFVAMESDFPDDVADLSKVWTLVLLDERLRSAMSIQRFRLACSRPLLRRPRHAMEALVGLRVNPDQVIIALITSGIAAAMVHERDSVRTMWAVAPAVAVLASDFTDPVCREAVERQCGDSAAAILETGTDPHAVVGGFGASEDAMAALTSGQARGIIQAAGVVPGALLDKDTRADAARLVFFTRESDGAARVGKSVETVIDAALTALPDPRAHAQVQARCHPRMPGGWQNIPAASAAFALLARSAARGDARCRVAEQNLRPMWIEMARFAPELVTLDLIRAELLLHHIATEAPA